MKRMSMPLAVKWRVPADDTSLNISFRNISVRPSFLLLMSIVFFFDEGNLTVFLLIAAAVHEAGHFFAIKRMGGKVEKLNIGALGAEAEYSGSLTYRKEIIACAAGPAAGFAFSFLTSLAAKAGIREFFFLSGLSAMLSVFNLLPILPLDGGRMLRFFLCEHIGLKAAADITLVVSGVLVILMVLVGAVLQIYSGGNNLLFISLCFIIIFVAKEIKVL